MLWSTAPRRYGAVISLGANCQVAYQLKRLGLREASYPLDWFYFMNTAALAGVLRTRFRQFMLRENLVVQHPSRTTLIVLDTATTCRSFHDFALPGEGQQPLADYLHFRSKLNRRVARLDETIRSRTPLLFIRNHLSREDAPELQSALDEWAGAGNYILLALNDQETEGMQELEWGIDGICSVQIGKGSQWYGSSASWDALMAGVQLLKPADPAED